MAALKVILVAALLIAQVMGHAVLITPTPLNTNPTTANPCGATVPTSASPVATFVSGQTQVIKWKLVAGDGGDRVTGKIDPNGGTSFTVDMWAGEKTHGTTTGVTYDIAFTVPSGVNCAKGACTFQVRSNTGWVSCSMINVSSCTGCPTPAPAPPTCTRTNTLSFCNEQSTKNVLIPSDSSPAALDLNAAAAFKSYLSNINVFTTNSSNNCQKLFKDFLCAENLPPCPGSDTTKIADGTACRSMCRQTMSACGLTTSHKDLYDCNSYPLCADEESSSSILSASIASLVVAFVAVALL